MTLRDVAAFILKNPAKAPWAGATNLRQRQTPPGSKILGIPTSNLQRDAVELANKQNEEPFPFLRLPAEIRNLIYNVLCPSQKPRLWDQPAITRVSRQVRAEGLAAYYRRPVHLLIEGDNPIDLVVAIYRIVDSFGGAPKSLSRSSTFQHVKGLDLHLTMPYGVHLVANLRRDSNGWLHPFPDNTYWRVVVGSPGMDWTDETAVETALGEAAAQLENNLRERLAGLLKGEEKPPSTVGVQQGALEAMCVLASACPPHLTNAICIFDISEDELDGCWGAIGRS